MPEIVIFRVPVPRERRTSGIFALYGTVDTAFIKTSHSCGIMLFLVPRMCWCAICVLHHYTHAWCSPLSFPSGLDGFPPTTSPPITRPAPGRHLVRGSLVQTAVICGTLARTALLAPRRTSSMPPWPGTPMPLHGGSDATSSIAWWPGPPAPHHVAAFPGVSRSVHTS